jgi:alpha-beta hydrolase superfamily lysophospholipase
MSEAVAAPRWVGPPDRPALMWVSAPEGGASTSGVLVLPPLGYQWWSTHRTLRVLAETLAQDGHLVARLDYDGTGDSAGDQWDGGRVAAWRRSVADAVGDLRAQGCRHIGVVGVRLGGGLALIDGHELGADAIALWAPVSNGKRWARELRLLAEEVPAAEDLLEGGTVSSAGIVFSAQTLADLNDVSAANLTAAPAPRALIVDEQPDGKLAGLLAALGVDVEARSVAGRATALDVATEDAIVPMEVVEAIRDWFGAGAPELAGPPAAPAPAAAAATARIAWRDGVVQETVTHLGPEHLAAVLTQPTAGPAKPGTLVFLNTGSEPHVGPGRAWVELARSLALQGHDCYRVDWRGWGESPSAGHAPGRPYDAHAIDDTVELVRALARAGREDIVLCGLCASAWVALRAVLEIDVAGVVALNPQLYWAPGDPVEATMAQTRRRRATEILEIREGARTGRWTEEDLAGERPWAAAWLDQLAAASTPVTMVFAEGDDGLEYLATRLHRRLAEARRAGLRVVELVGVDHSMHRVWTRQRVAETIASAAAEMLSPARAGDGVAAQLAEDRR